MQHWRVTMEMTRYEVKELSPTTWPDFENLFSRGNGWDHCWCIHFQRPCGLPKSEWLRTRAERSVRNKPLKKALVDSGRAHGILVYFEGEPVGWCQYGPRDELPRIDNARNYVPLDPQPRKAPWRITCFVVDRRFRRRGIATIALRAALQSIRKKGGGMVEAFPVADWEGKSFGNMSTHGTVSMFEKVGFVVAAPYGTTNVIMRRSV